MSYILQWKNPAVDPLKTNITVPVASTVSNAASITFTGKGAANYGKVQQENLMRLLEHFADGTAPLYPTVGQLWYDTNNQVLKLCTSAAPLNWRSLAGVQVTDVGLPAPANPNLGDIWFERTGPLSGFLYVYTGLGRFPINASVNGGWNQIWPQPQEAALRDEYDEVSLAVDLLIDGTTQDGNGAEDLLFTELPNFTALDADLDAKYALSPDTVVNSSGVADLRAQPYSGDWDALLSAARWALARLDIPANMYEDISPIPFVQDGRQPPTFLTTSYATNDVRYPTFERLSGRRYGTVTMSRLYAETMNVLAIAASNRYNLRGMSGSSGTISTFSPEVAQYTHSIRAGAFTGGSTATVVNVMRWTSGVQRNRFVYGGNAIELTLAKTQPGAASAADTALNTFINKHNRFRINADKVRAMVGAVAPYQLAVAPSAAGLKTPISVAGPQQLGVFTEGAVTLTITGNASSSNIITLTASLSGVAAGVTGTTTVTCRIIKDCTAYGGADIDLFAFPTAYNSATDATGTSATFLNVAAGLPPVANFTASPLAPAVGANVTFTWTGSGAPTLVEWDLDNDGVFELTGNSINTTFPSAGRRTIRVRGTNATGSDVLTRSAYINVT